MSGPALAASTTSRRRQRPDRSRAGAGPVDDGEESQRAQIFEPDQRARIDALVKERDEARRRRDWAWADALRAELDALGVALEDARPGRSGSGRAGRRPRPDPGRAAPGPGGPPSRTRPIEEVLVESEARDRHADILALARQAGVRCSRVPGRP